MTEYVENAMPVNSNSMDRIRAAVQDANIWVGFGMAERSHGSLYMSYCWIDPVRRRSRCTPLDVLMTWDFQIGNVTIRRKLRPTGLERILFGEATGRFTPLHRS